MRFALISVLLGAVALSGCTTASMNFAEPEVASRSLATRPSAEVTLEAQAVALEGMTRDIIRKSTMQGAALGAVAGCSLAMISATSASRCLGGVVVGGALGAATGHQLGQKSAQARLSLIATEDVAQSLSRASARLGTVTSGLSEVLDAQDAERAELATQLADGRLSQEAYDARLEEMIATRRAVAQALQLTASQAREARDALAQAAQRGQTGIDWHLEAAETLETEALSARSQITLL